MRMRSEKMPKEVSIEEKEVNLVTDKKIINIGVADFVVDTIVMADCMDYV